MTVNNMSAERQQSYINELKRCVKEDCDFYLEHNETYEFNNYINQLQQENQKYKEVIDKAIKHVSSLSSKGRDCRIYANVKKDILDILKEVE